MYVCEIKHADLTWLFITHCFITLAIAVDRSAFSSLDDGLME